MRPFRAAASAALAAALAGCQHHEEAAGPAGIPYGCSDGHPVRIVFDGGDPNRVPARLERDGATVLLRPQPAATGLLYASESGLVWWAEGDEARLLDGEREIARCTRVREGEAAAPEHHGDDH